MPGPSKPSLDVARRVADEIFAAGREHRQCVHTHVYDWGIPLIAAALDAERARAGKVVKAAAKLRIACKAMPHESTATVVCDLPKIAAAVRACDAALADWKAGK